MSGQIENMYKLQKKDIPNVGAVLADTFQDDPVWKKVFEGESNLDQKFRAFFETPIRYCLRYGEVYANSENLEGIAAWIPGDLADMTLWRVIRSGAIKSGMKIGAKPSKRVKPIFKILDEDRKEIMKGKQYIYLLIVGVASKFQGQGFGGKLIRAVIEKSEGLGIPIYLETETENNVNLYERFGFKLAKNIILPGIDCPMWGMVRQTNPDCQ